MPFTATARSRPIIGNQTIIQRVDKRGVHKGFKPKTVIQNEYSLNIATAFYYQPNRFFYTIFGLFGPVNNNIIYYALLIHILCISRCCRFLVNITYIVRVCPIRVQVSIVSSFNILLNSFFILFEFLIFKRIRTT